MGLHGRPVARDLRARSSKYHVTLVFIGLALNLLAGVSCRDIEQW